VSVPKTPGRRGQSADWSDPWPVKGITREEPEPSPGVDALRAEGFRMVFDVEPIDADRDEHQDHLSNIGAVRMFNDLRVAYVASRLAPDWPRFVRRGGRTVVVRELHVQYESEGWMDDRFVGGVRWAARRGKSALVEQRLVEATSARPLARAWVVQLFVTPDGVAAFPDWLWEMIAEVEGAPVHEIEGERAPWGPPP
jgi:acyl-CoA thioesterase FadM